ncbi:iron ABC transporter substrate-binding protein [Granulosicoccus antarcticus]|uniref:Vitamin B12-binding protein n=1 Tax=Granulosicoccus antarcticus IMCC3135 TaxID=1192854 RepID=A0A2Z2NIR6_9GAMM|nr:iron ABC transporter substrate-binding protein [Granulosicoccus antarcticus]ASJ70953.1 Vitamin B12-binding protein [Granulosicoccus antarcticus IMCC3135]
MESIQDTSSRKSLCFATLVVMLSTLCSPAIASRSIIDSAGRTVEIPDTINTVFAAGPPASVLVYVVRPETLAGWPRALRKNEIPYIAADYQSLPETGRLTGRGGEANLETVLSIKPDLIIDFGSIRDTYIDLANRVQAQTGIPYVLIDGRFDQTPAALRLTGDILGASERGEALARAAEKLFSRVDAITAAVAEGDRPRVYLARGPDGLETGSKGSINTEIIERAGGRNVIDAGDGRHGGLVEISMENMIAVDPDYIVTWDQNFFADARQNPLWAGISAMQEDQFYLSPTAPFGWIDRPPSLNRIIGLQWMSRLLYPEQWDTELSEEAAQFYQDWYHVELDEEQLQVLLSWAEGQPPE